MLNLRKKITATIATGALVLSGLTTSAFANYNVQITNAQENFEHSQQHFRGNSLFTFMTGSQEVPGPGDPDAFGVAKVKIDPDAGKFCVNMHVFRIDKATAAHVHEGQEGVAGPIVIHLPTPDDNGRAHECVDADSNKLKDIQENPTNYYINVHNEVYPSGALRGQLH